MFKLQNMKLYPWLVVAMSCLFLFYKYLAQVSPSVMTNDLMRTFHMHATGLGSLAACFLYSYLLTQLFAGPLLDRFSVRLLSAGSLLLISFSFFAFAHSHSLLLAYVSRMLMGVGAAFATVSYLKLAAVWFSARQYSLVAGFLATAASAGGMFSQVPLALSVKHFGWQHTLLYCGELGVVVCLVYFLFVRDDKEEFASLHCMQDDDNSNSGGLNFFALKEMLLSRKVWLLTLYSGLAWAPLAVFGGLWGNPFLQTVYMVSKTEASRLIALAFLGLAVGGPLAGYAAKKLNTLFPVMLAGLCLSLVCVSMVVFARSHDLAFVGANLFLFGLGTGAFMLGFSFGKKWFNAALMATFVGVVNTGDALFTAVTEPMVGKVLDLNWAGKVSNGVHVYSAHSYELAMMLLPVFLLLALLTLLFVKKYE